MSRLKAKKEDDGSNTYLVASINEIAYSEGISADDIFKVLEHSLQKANEKKYGKYKTHVHIDKKTGATSVTRRLLVVADEEDLLMPEEEHDGQLESPDIHLDTLMYDGKIHISDALRKKYEAEVGDIVSHSMPNIDIDYIPALLTRKNIFSEFNRSRRKKQFESYQDRVNEIVIGIVRRVERGSVILDINGTEAFLPAKNIIKGEIFKTGDRVKAIIEDVCFSLTRSQIILSRTSTVFLCELMKHAITEIYDGIISIKCAVREPGSRAKVAVFSTSRDIEPVGACIGIKGSRINSVSKDINGEKIDIVEWSSDQAKFVINAFPSINILKITIDEEKSNVDIVVPQSSLSLLIGRKGQNIRLVSSLVSAKINALSEEDSSKNKLKEFYDVTASLIKDLGVEEILAQILITEGLKTVEDVHNFGVENLSCIEGFDYELANALYTRALECINEREEKISVEMSDLGVEENVRRLKQLSNEHIVRLADNNIKSMQDIANLSGDEMLDIVPDMDKDKANEIILLARNLVKMI